MLVGQVGQHRQVLVLGGLQAGGAEGQHAGPHEAHGEDHQQQGAALQHRRRPIRRPGTVFALQGNGELRDRGRVVEGEHQHRDDYPNGHRQVTERGHTAETLEVPAGDEKKAHAEQDQDQRVDQPLRDDQHDALTGQHHQHHQCDQQPGEQPPRRGRQSQLVDHEAIHGVGDTHPVDQHNGEDSQEVQHSDHPAHPLAECLAGYHGDVLAGGRGCAHETRKRPVGQIGHGTDEEGHDQQRPQTPQTGIDGQEQDSRAHGCPEEGDGPVHLKAFIGHGVGSVCVFESVPSCCG